MSVVLQRASLSLRELEESPKYRALAASGTSRRFNSFRQRVEMLRARCGVVSLNPAETQEVRTRLKELRAECRGSLLGGFRLLVDKALREIGQSASILFLAPALP